MAQNDLTIALSRLKTDFTMVSGDDKDLAFSLTEEDGTATTITSATILFKAVKSGLRGTVAISKSTGGSGVTITSGSGGTFTVALDPADTTSLSGDYYYEVKVTFSGGNVSHPFRGAMTVEPKLI